MIYLISDTHFFHKKIQEYTGRPNDWQNLIISNWNRRVTENDDIFHLGDFALGSSEDFISVRNQLHGKLYLLKGNHDRRSEKFYEENSIIILPSFYHDNTLFPDTVFSHRPLERAFIPVLNIHGHIHEKNIEDGLHFNVSVENINYAPILFGEIQRKLKGINDYN